MPKKKKKVAVPDRDRARAILDELWAKVLATETLPVRQEIIDSINHSQTGIRFVLPTQLLGKLTNNALDALSLQRKDDDDDEPSDRWDARSFSRHVIAKWNLANQAVLGPSHDPYVGNPLRRPRLDTGLDQMGDRAAWEKLCEILGKAQAKSDPSYTTSVLVETLGAIRDRLRELSFKYVVPPRVSLSQAEMLTTEFLKTRSKGDRGLAVAAALFMAIKDRFGIYKEIRRGVINESDASAKSAGDLECIDNSGNVILAVEVKERRIGDDDVTVALGKARDLSVKELIFCSDGIRTADEKTVEKNFATAWASGTSLYNVTISELMHAVLPILGAEGIKSFVVHIGKQLDAFGTQPSHRNAWKSLLDLL